MGERLAAACGYPFLDLDAEMERALGLSIATLFTQRGEPFFRKEEAHLLRRLGSLGRYVLATGGGTATADNMAYMKERGTVLYLKVPWDRVWARYQGGQRTPPLWADLRKDMPSARALAALSGRFGHRLKVYETAQLAYPAMTDKTPDKPPT